MPYTNRLTKLKSVLLEACKREPLFFYLFVFINLLPVLSFKFFPTVDGPAHLYNSNLIVDLLKDHAGTVSGYFSFNPNVNPNWSGHILLSLFVSILPGFVAEKIVLLIYLVGLPLSLRHLFNTISIKSKYLLYLIFPFTYSFLFYYGFYNFNIGLVLFIFGISLWIKYKSHPGLRPVLILALISALIYLSHPFVFILFLVFILLLNIGYLIQLRTYSRDTLKNYFKNILLQLSALSIGIIFTLKFIFSSRLNDSHLSYLSVHDILVSLKYIMPAKGINYEGLNQLSKLMLYVFASYVIYFSCSLFYDLYKRRKIHLKNLTWLAAALVTLALLFILPDGNRTMGFVSSRLMLFFFIFIITWMAAQEVSFRYRVIIFAMVCYINVGFVLHNYNSAVKGCRLAEEIHHSSGYIKPNSVVLPILKSNYFIYKHISNYLGADKPMVILENYEAALDYFPLKWNNNILSGLPVNQADSNDICKSRACLNADAQKIDYVFILDDGQQVPENACMKSINNTLSEKYTLLFSGENGIIKLYKHKS